MRCRKTPNFHPLSGKSYAIQSLLARTHGIAMPNGFYRCGFFFFLFFSTPNLEGH